jgi:murein DD-endopeptidase MepM/ murein hydrolase activator NlpD
MPDRDEIMRAVQKLYDTRMMRPGQKFTIERAADGSVSAFELVVSKVKTVRVHKDGNGAWIGSADEAQTRIEVEEVGGRIASSLYKSIKEAGEATELVAFFVDVFAYDLDFYVDTHPGDEFRVLVEKEYKDTEFLRYKRIIAAEYAGKAGTYRAFYWKSDKQKTGRYYDEKGRSVEKSLLKTPLKFSRISSKFNPRRMHPVLHRVKGHFGVDYAAPTGTPVWAAASGVITTRAYSGGAGNLVVIKHDDGLVTKYMHLSKFAKNQKVGQRVEAKTVIGFVGTTGLSTGPHLHFGVMKNGAHVDPLKLAPTRGRGVAKEDLATFKSEVASLVERLAAIPVTSTPVAPAPADDTDTDDEAAADVVGDESSTALAPEPPTAHP